MKLIAAAIAVAITLATTGNAAFTEFYCNSAGSNINAGSTTGAATHTWTNGGWNGTTVFTVTDGTNPSTFANVGDFVAVMLDSATVASVVARVTVVQNATNGTITISGSAQSTTTTVTSGASGRTLVLGGAWRGPNGTVNWPFSTGQVAALTNVAGDTVRINMKNDQTYTPVSTFTNSPSGTCAMEGYTGSAGDGGQAVWDGGGGASFTCTFTGGWQITNVTFQNMGTASGSNNAVSTAGDVVIHCIFTGNRGTGITSANSLLIECEAYGNNTTNTATKAGFQATADTTYLRCYSHDNTGSNSAGFIDAASANNQVSFVNCISDTNGGSGFLSTTSATGANVALRNCDAYNNGGAGWKQNGTGAAHGVYIENSNFIKNGTYAIDGNSPGTMFGLISNNAYGAGTQANSTGTTHTLGGIIDNGSSVTYASNVTPYFAPTTGDFRINLAAANFAGRGAFTQTGNSKTGTVGYPDIGAAQSKTGVGGTFTKQVSHGVAQ